jgi:ATP-dependent DNA helicase RecG
VVDKKNKQCLRKIGNAESTTVEWKKSTALINEIIETAAAFANTEGGRIFIGVAPNGEIIGVQIGKGTIENLANQISQHTDPKVMPKISIKKIDSKDVIVVDVKASLDRLVLAYGRPHKRVGRSSPKMSKDEYERLILEKHRQSLPFDAEVCKGASLSDIDSEKVMSFLSVAKEERGLDIDAKSSVKDVLMRLNLLKGKKLTNASILLFGKKTRSFFTQSESKCIRFKGLDVTGEMIDLKPINGDIVSQLKDIEKFIYDHIFMRAWIESGKMERQEKWEYPPKAIREALANAMAHDLHDYCTITA